MTTKPDPIEARLAERAAMAPPDEHRPAVPSRADLERICEELNRRRRRNGLIWIIDGHDVRLVDCPEASRVRSRQIEERLEAERHEWKRRHGHNPVPAAPHWTDDRDDYEGAAP